MNNNQSFYGEFIVTLYENKVGLYPYFRNHTDLKSAVNGGIPQRVNMTMHLIVLHDSIVKAIPNPRFDGFAVFDLESWRPLYDLNWGSKKIYQEAAMEHTKQQNPHIEDKKVLKKMAVKEFNKAAARFLKATIRLAFRIRPQALWGFYGLPYCNYDAGKNDSMECAKKYQDLNDRLGYLFHEVSALYPSIYLKKPPDNAHGYRYIHAVLQEAKRAVNNTKRRMPIIAYTGMEYFPCTVCTKFYSKRDLCSSLKQASDMGLQGAIIWSTSRNMNKKRCKKIGSYVNNTLGHYVKTLKNFTRRCATKKCRRHGQCILPIRQSFCKSKKPLSEYFCLCDPKFYGPRCNRSKILSLFYGTFQPNATTKVLNKFH